jgi:hypothetical protein
LRDGYTILEYTVGKDNSVPEELSLAKQRFKRRRHTVERYYKKMGYIENRFKEAFWDPGVYFCKFVTGVFRIPAVALADYRYRHNPKYREKVIKRQEQEDLKEETVIKKLREGLTAYLQKDLEQEEVPLLSQALPQEATSSIVAKASGGDTPQKALRKTRPPKVRVAKIRAAKVRSAPQKKSEVLGELRAVITARPTRGYSPLKVYFSASQSYSPQGKIIAYAWDFGDGDTSTRKNPVNTYWSTSYEPCSFTATLVISDAKGNSATAQKTIEVINR